VEEERGKGREMKKTGKGEGRYGIGTPL